jgi:hypothetical protein
MIASAELGGKLTAGQRVQRQDPAHPPLRVLSNSTTGSDVRVERISGQGRQAERRHNQHRKAGWQQRRHRRAELTQRAERELRSLEPKLGDHARRLRQVCERNAFVGALRRSLLVCAACH